VTTAAFDLAGLARELGVLHARLLEAAPDLQPGVERAVEGLQTGLEELRVAEAQLRAQNDELIASQLALEVERARLADLFDAAPDAYIVTDDHGVILEANDAAEQLFGFLRTELSGKPVAVFVARSERRAFRTWLRRAATDGDAPPLVTLVERRGYARLYAECVVTTIGSTSELRWLVRDVTDRVLVERSLWELNAELEERVATRTADLDTQRAQLQELMRQMPVGVLIGDESGRALTPMNMRAVELLAGAEGSVDAQFRLRYPDGREVPEGSCPRSWPLEAVSRCSTPGICSSCRRRSAGPSTCGPRRSSRPTAR
jgi:PAS domain S-box-containing protein